ncbi:hypothetical protein KFE25_013909 [Diacronema lutheri]|uniref:Protein kinase domain-containing protein n=1 Tax=Diacronema lutheri TaxID=2081491 RepID=A0A8J5XMP6_DIALT|nr:hypothetical protein KFE25_013909 [Diacronema lutheri]
MGSGASRGGRGARRASPEAKGAPCELALPLASPAAEAAPLSPDEASLTSARPPPSSPSREARTSCPTPPGSPSKHGFDAPLRQLLDAVSSGVLAGAAAAAAASRAVGGAANKTLFRLVDAMAGGIARLTVLQLKLQLGKSLANATPLNAPLTPDEVHNVIEELGLRGEACVLREVLGRHHAQHVTRQTLLAGLVAVALGSYGDKVCTLFLLFDDSMDGRLQHKELLTLFHACCAFKPSCEWDGSMGGVSPEGLAGELCAQLGTTEDERAAGVTLAAFFDFCKLRQAQFEPLLTLAAAPRRVLAAGSVAGRCDSSSTSLSPERDVPAIWPGALVAPVDAALLGAATDDAAGAAPSAARLASAAPPHAPGSRAGDDGAASGGASAEAELEDGGVLTGFASTEIIDSSTLTTRELLGSGSFSDVYAGSWLGTPVAVKVIKGAQRHQLAPPTLAALKREVRVLERVRHPNCIMLLGWSQAPLAVVTELCHGAAISGQLSELLMRSQGLDAAGEPLAPHRDARAGADASYSLRGEGHARWVLAVARDVARGMAYLHHLLIVHRDLKGANLLADAPLLFRDARRAGAGASRADGWPVLPRVRIADFGLARAIEGTVGLEAAAGSIVWMAPEVMTAAAAAPAVGAPAGGASARPSYGVEADVFSFGIVLHELMHARTPYSQLGREGRAPHPIAVLYRVCNEGLRPELPVDGWLVRAGLAELMVQCWASSPAERPPFAAVLARLDAVEAALDAQAAAEGAQMDELIGGIEPCGATAPRSA